MSFILTEQEKVIKRRKWLRENGWTYDRLARHMDLARGTAFDLIGQPHIRPERVEQLRSAGMPEDLLPEARYTPPGRRPKPGRHQG